MENLQSQAPVQPPPPQPKPQPPVAPVVSEAQPVKKSNFFGVFIFLLFVVGIVYGGWYVWKNQLYTKIKLPFNPPTPTATPFPSLIPEPSLTATPSGAIILEISQPQGQITISQAEYTIEGKTVPGAQVSINDDDLVADGEGIFSQEVALDEGENSFLVFVNDEEGNWQEKEVLINYEPQE